MERKTFDELFEERDGGMSPRIPIKKGDSTMGGGVFKGGSFFGIDKDDLPNKIFNGRTENGMFVIDSIEDK